MKSVIKSFVLAAGLTAFAPIAFSQETAPAPAPAPESAPAADSSPRSSISNGLIFVEPGVTYTFGSKTTGEVDNVDDTSGKANGFGLMGRAGFHLKEVVLLGLDARYSWLDFEDSGLGGSADATGFNYGPFVGIQMPNVGLRVWGTWVAGGNLNPKSIGSSPFDIDVKASDAKGYRLGAGFRVLSLSLNLEYQNVKYNDIEKQGGVFPGGYDGIKLKDESWVASVSFPLEL